MFLSLSSSIESATGSVALSSFALIYICVIAQTCGLPTISLSVAHVRLGESISVPAGTGHALRGLPSSLRLVLKLRIDCIPSLWVGPGATSLNVVCYMQGSEHYIVFGRVRCVRLLRESFPLCCAVLLAKEAAGHMGLEMPPCGYA